MATAVASDIIHVPGQIIVDPTSLAATAAPLFGGTALGKVAEVILTVLHRGEDLRGEEYASELIDVFEGSDEVMIGAFLRGFDFDAWQAVWGATQSTVTDKPVLTWPGTPAFGTDRSRIVLFAPEDHAEAPGIILYNAIPLPAENLKHDFSREREFGLAAIFRGTRDSSSRLGQQSLLEDMPQVLP